MIRRCGKAVLFVFCVMSWCGLAMAASAQKTIKHKTPSRRSHHSTKKNSVRPVKVEPRIHVVKPGDSLYEIARAGHTTVRELKSVNRLRTNRLRIGQRLRVPESHVSIANREKRKSRAGAKSEIAEPAASMPTESENGDGPAPVPAPNITMRSAESLSGDSTSEAEDSESLNVRMQLVQAGLDFLGVPYRWKGVSERRGVDCSGLVMTLFDKFNIELPHSAREQFKLGEKVARTELAIGDLVFFSTRGKIPTHVGIYIGDNRFLHAASRARQVIISNLSQSWYRKRYLGARRMEDLWKDDSKTAPAKGN